MMSNTPIKSRGAERGLTRDIIFIRHSNRGEPAFSQHVSQLHQGIVMLAHRH